MTDFDSSKNLLTIENGATVFEVSSFRPRCEASSILSNEKGVWVSEEGLPQHIIIDLSKLAFRPEINFFGWYCWHSYTSNPSIVELFVGSDSTSFKKWGSFQGQLSAKPQCFAVEPISKGAKFVKILIKETFGAPNCYLNKIFMFEKIQKSKKKIDESMVNISEISSNSHDTFQVPIFERNFKSKLKYQLEDLEGTVNILKEKYDHPDEIEELKTEVQDCQERMQEISENLKVLIDKVGKVEKSAKGFGSRRTFGSVKEEIIREIRDRKRRKGGDKIFNQVTYKLEESKASDILAMIRLKTEEKMRKVEELEREKRRIIEDL